MKWTAVLVCSSYLASASAKHAKSNTVMAQRELSSSSYDTDDDNIDLTLKPPPYMNSIINQVLDAKGGGHMNYLNVYPSSWTTNQVNSELTVDVTFKAVVNSQSQHCSAHISASMLPGSGDNATILPTGSTLTCTGSGRTGNPGYGAPLHGVGYQSPQNPPQIYRQIYNPPLPHVVYRTKLVPTLVATLVGPPPPQNQFVQNPYSHVPQNPYLPALQNPYGQLPQHPYSHLQHPYGFPSPALEPASPYHQDLPSYINNYPY